jgi:NitT/TauT family transport system substrate-binding protein
MHLTSHRPVLAGGAVFASTAMASRPTYAATKVTFLTSWFARAEHGGFHQAKAEGLYEKPGPGITIKLGGPQVNGLQLLTAGEADIIMGYDIQTLGAASKSLAIRAAGSK